MRKQRKKKKKRKKIKREKSKNPSPFRTFFLNILFCIQYACAKETRKKRILLQIRKRPYIAENKIEIYRYGYRSRTEASWRLMVALRA
ncbi:hypothetical protein ERO13_D01G176801v2 [Gossypium hirsutum]|nr:hypothetical protein ERO13_D01G176801v2 [Gossypium hirsutum]